MKAISISIIILSLITTAAAHAEIAPPKTVVFKFGQQGSSLVVSKTENQLTFQKCSGAGQCQSIGRTQGYTIEEIQAAKRKLDLTALAYGAGVATPVSICGSLLSVGAGLATLIGGATVLGEINDTIGFFSAVIAYVGIIPVTVVTGLTGLAYTSDAVHKATGARDKYYSPSSILRSANPDGISESTVWQELYAEGYLTSGDNSNEFLVSGDSDLILSRIEKVLHSIPGQRP
jgi:hypothetical protein